MTPKKFQDLIDEVHNKGICQECGGCVSFCSSAEYDVIKFVDGYSYPVFIQKDKCLECGICYCICPQTHILDEYLDQTYKFSDYSSMPLGFFEEICSCQATDKEFLKYGTDGGVVNSIINYLLEKKIVDGAIVSKVEGPFTREAMFADKKNELLKASGIKLEISSHLDEIQKFCTYTQSIPKLNHYKFKKLVVVGTPCQLYTIRCMQNLGVTPSQNIEICLGLFCYENFQFDTIKAKKFEKDFAIEFENIEKINIREDLILKLRDDGSGERIVHIPFNHLTDYIRPACNACNDFTNIYADISFGGLGSQEKYTTVIPRTEKGNEILNKARSDGIIRCLDLNETSKDNIEKLVSQYSQMKINRKKNFMNELK